MFKKIFILVLLAIISCRQNTAPLLISPPKEDDEITDGDNSEGDNTGGGNTGDSWYGYYDVSILTNGISVQTVKYSISDTDKLLKVYSNMIIDSESGKAQFELSKNNSSSQTVGNSAAEETYSFDANLNLTKKESPEIISKRFRGVCIVRIYPDAEEKSDNSSLLGYYTIAGVYTEMEKNNTGSISRAMIKSEVFQNYGYDELIILRHDIEIKDTTSEASDTSSVNTANYRADILFNDDEGINFYYYNPDRVFKNQNTNYIFKRIVESATE